MDQLSAQHIAIVGAGPIGIASAISLQQAGCQVSIFDASKPGAETCAGNAGALATTAIFPLSDWRTLYLIPAWLIDPLAPLAIQWRYIFKLAPWLWRFVLAGNASRYQRSTHALANLLIRTTQDWEALLTAANLTGCWRRNGSLTLYPDKKSLMAECSKQLQLLHAHGLSAEILHANAIAEHEPLLKGRCAHAIYTPSWSYFDDPYQLAQGLAAYAQSLGVSIYRKNVQSFHVEQNTIRAAVLDDQSEASADHFLICAGIASDTLLKPLGIKIPLETERGYHATLPQAAKPLQRFLQFAQEGFVVLPMPNGAIRLAGTVELATRHAPPHWKRAHALVVKAETWLGKLNTENVSYWMGKRPSLPDSVPIIARANPYSNLLISTGHGHLGLTLAATTAVLLRHLTLNEPSPLSTAAYQIER